MKKSLVVLTLCFTCTAFAGTEGGVTKHASANGIPLAEYRASAAKGDPIGQNSLGVLYLEGSGVEKSSEEAAKWFRLAALQGYALAEYNLARMYLQGDGVVQSDGEAFKWAFSSARKREPAGEYLLASLYAQGRGVSADLAESERWLLEAGSHGYIPAQMALGKIYSGSLRREEGAKWYRRAAEQGYAEAQYELGIRYRAYLVDDGDGLNLEHSEKWLRLAAEQGFVRAQGALGAGYRRYRRDYPEAIRWLRLAAAQNDVLAQCELGNMYENGEGVEANRVVAYSLYALSLQAKDDASNAGSSRDELAKSMSLSYADLRAADALTREMARAGNLLNALDRYVARSEH